MKNGVHNKTIIEIVNAADKITGNNLSQKIGNWFDKNNILLYVLIARNCA